METEKSAKAFPVVFLLIIAAILVCCAHYCHGQTPALTVSAGTGSQASTLAIGSDSARPWKRFAVTSSGSGAFTIVSAEHGTGDDGGIYFYTLSVSAGTVTPGPVTPPAPVDTLPIGTLTTAVTAAAAGVDAAALTAMSNGYEALAQQVDAGAVATPTQLYLVMGVQILSLTGDQRAAVQPLTTAVAAWLNAQQTAGKLDETKMPDYSRVFHAIAKAMRPGTVTPAHQAPSAKVPSPAENPGGPAAPASPCANGHCPASGPSQPGQSQPAWFRRWR